MQIGAVSSPRQRIAHHENDLHTSIATTIHFGIRRSSGDCFGLCGCYRGKLPATPTKPPDVIVALPVIRDVTDFEEFTGRTEAYRYLEIRSRVSGELMRVHFTDGDHVVKGAVLFEIDDRPYKAYPR